MADKPKSMDVSHIALSPLLHHLSEEVAGHLSENCDKVSQVLKHILNLGYRIMEPPKSPDLEQDKDTLSLAAFLKKSAVQMDMQSAVSLWLGRDRTKWQNIPDIYLGLGKRVLSLKEPLLAFDILSEGIDAFGGVTRLKELPEEKRPVFLAMQQQRALALAESGALPEANRIMMALASQGLEDGETLGILGRTFKDLALQCQDPLTRQKYFDAALKSYHRAYLIAVEQQRFNDIYYNGINAATITLLAGNPQKSRILAGAVRDICMDSIRKKENPATDVPYWLSATLGEAELLLGHHDIAATWYQKAADHRDVGIRERISMQRQARLILEKQGKTRKLLDSCFSIPGVVVCHSQMMYPDQYLKNRKYFNEVEIREKIRQHLSQMNAGVGYGTAVCEWDILVLEELVSQGAEINIVLPVEKDVCRRMTVSRIPEASWGDRFERLIKKASRVWILTRHDPLVIKPNLAFSWLFLLGIARTRAQMMDKTLNHLSLTEGHLVRQSLDSDSHNSGQVTSSMPESTNISEKMIKKNDLKKTEHNLKTIATVRYNWYLPMMFSDLKGYSRLTDEQLVRFCTCLLPYQQSILNRYHKGIIAKRTEGDSQFLVFRDFQTAFQVAWEQKVLVETVNWTDFGLPADLSIRFSLDAGPCYSFIDPILEQTGFCGAYVNRAARIEPITPPGHIYASETFVALAKATGLADVLFEYVGQVSLPKNYGTIPVFHVNKLSTFNAGVK